MALLNGLATPPLEEAKRYQIELRKVAYVGLSVQNYANSRRESYCTYKSCPALTEALSCRSSSMPAECARTVKEETGVLPKCTTMNGGEGPHSYVKNSFYQEGGLNAAKAIIDMEIAENLDMNQLLSSSNVFCIADFGCSTGPNTFIVVENIIQAIKSKCQSSGLINPDQIKFQVFFSDRTFNDFNTLFRSLPLQRPYFAAGVPGSFHGCLFPKASLHFVHTSYSIQWLSKVPKEVTDKNSPAWNKGRILYHHKEAEAAYSAQFSEDIDSFLNARGEEIVCGGFMDILLPCIPTGANPSECAITAWFQFVGFTLMDMAKLGLVDEAKVDSFNLPLYHATPEEWEAIIKKNGCFSIVRSEQLARQMPVTRPDIEKFAAVIRAGLEGQIRQQFGSEIIDELFDRYKEKLIESRVFSRSRYAPLVDLLIVLKRINA